MARASRVTLFEREIREKLSVAAIEILLERARILSEGKRSAAPTARARYFGSTMITVDVGALADVRARAVRRALRRARRRAHPRRRARHQARAQDRRARSRAARRRPVRVRAGDVRVRAQGTFVYLDVDVEE